ncbi:MAG TPA: AtpZ/AtpI family protein [Acetobacteraceae bacterium]|jgi:ATP synthase protein I
MSEEPGDEEPPSFEERLKAARSRQGLDAPPPALGTKSDDMGGMSPWGIGLRVGIELVSALVVAVAIGYGLDHWFGTKPILTAVFVLLGGAAGILNVWRMFAPRPTVRQTTQDRGR